MDARLAFLLALCLVALAAPRPYGYLAALATVPLAARSIRWVDLRPRYLIAAIVIYLAALLLDFLSWSPPQARSEALQAVALAPLAEEYVFRALPFASLPRPMAWIFATAIFGVLHPANPALAALYGLSLAAAYRGGGLLASTALHSVNNALWIWMAK